VRHCRDWERIKDALDRHAVMGNVRAAEHELFRIDFLAMQRSSQVTSLCNLVLKACGRSGDEQRAAEWIRRMRRSGVRANARSFGKLLTAAATCGDVEGVCHLLESLPPELANEVHASTAVNACARAGRPDKAVALVRRFEARRILQDVVTLNSLVNAFARDGRYTEAVRWLEEMDARGITPDVISYNSVVHACARAGRIDQAAGWMGRMRSRRVAPNMVSFSSMIDAYARLGRVAAATACLRSMEAAAHIPNLIVYNTVINACARQAQSDVAIEWLHKMKAHPLLGVLACHSAMVSLLEVKHMSGHHLVQLHPECLRQRGSFHGCHNLVAEDG